MELLDIIDENGLPTGETVERTFAHENGIRHRTSHVWIFREKMGRIEVLLQKRSENKDSFPGCYDISSAGHIPAGIDFVPSAIRELKEELGLDVTEKELIYCGTRRLRSENIFYGKTFIDNQISNAYMMWRDIDTTKLNLQKEEVESVLWIDFNECYNKVKNNEIKSCINMEELDILKNSLANQNCCSVSSL